LASIIKRVVLGVILAAVMLIVTAPMSLYFVGLNDIDGRPELPRTVASPQEIDAVWREVRGVSTPHIAAITPYSYLYLIYSGGKPDRGSVVAWQVARTYNLVRIKSGGGMSRWHLSGAALLIWLTQNWTQEQIFSKVVEDSRKKPAGKE